MSTLGKDDVGSDESRFNEVLVQNNTAQLHQIFAEYLKIAEYDIEDGIRKKFSGDIKRGFLAIGKKINVN